VSHLGCDLLILHRQHWIAVFLFLSSSSSSSVLPLLFFLAGSFAKTVFNTARMDDLEEE